MLVPFSGRPKSTERKYFGGRTATRSCPSQPLGLGERNLVLTWSAVQRLQPQETLIGVEWQRQFPCFLSQLSCLSGLKVNACSNSSVVYVFLLVLLSYLNGNVKQFSWRLVSNEMTEWSLTIFIIWSRVKAPPEPLDFTVWIRFQAILKMHIMYSIDRHRSELYLIVLYEATTILIGIFASVTAHLNAYKLAVLFTLGFFLLFFLYSDAQSMVLTNASQTVGAITNAALNLTAEQTQNPHKIAFSLCDFLNVLMYFCKRLTMNYTLIWKPVVPFNPSNAELEKRGL